MRICKKKLSLLAAASMLSVAPGALAQTTAQTPASAELPGSNASVVDGSSGDIVVTAQKRSERLIDVPASISVLTGTQLEKTGATNLVDYAASEIGRAHV